jgi:formylglycine-generating enzyme required for sulfatase activity
VAGGAVLGRLDDPRLLNPDTGKAEGCHEGRQPADYWCSVAAGPCFHGEGRERRGRGAALRQVELPQGFRIARYPVTNMEYGRFIAAHGYAEPRWWTPAGWAFVSQAGQSEMAEESNARITRAALWGVSPYDGPTQPVVGVSWYEAAAYCAWLTERGRTAGWLYHGEMLRLPTALEWERAARHTDQRSYPWGDEEPDAGRANFEETGLRAPTPVGCFPAGAAVCGALDLAGNVWEWTASLADELDSLVPRGEIAEGQMPAIKGGAFNWAGEALRCGAHYWFHPSQRYNLLGFRLVWVARDGGAE